MHDSAGCSICGGQSVDGSMTDDEFFRFVTTCVRELEEKQKVFFGQFPAGMSWKYELNDHSLIVGSKRFKVTLIGSYSPAGESWLWGWANEAMPANARESSASIQGLFDVTGFRVFTDPGFPARPEDAEDLTACAVHHLDAIGFFRDRSAKCDVYLAVHA